MRSAGRWTLVALSVFVAILVVTAVFIASSPRPPSGGTSTPIAPPPVVTAELNVSAVPHPVSPAFYGVGIESGTALSHDTDALLAATPIRYLRFPDGTAGDMTDLVNDSVYTPGSANVTLAPVSIKEFIATCRAVNCSAILELPLEIDNPGTAAYEVEYIQRSLDFDPAYWELGNEPAMWPCFDVPWAEWATGCHGGPTPAEYAVEVQAYIAAIRAIAPSARFIGLGGTDGPSWITPLEALDGSELAGVSQHSYVDDLLASPENTSLANYFSGLTSATSLPNLLSTARRAIATACPGCATQVFVTEMDSVSVGQPLAEYLPTFYNGVFFAAEIAQGLDSQATNIEPFTWENAVDGLVNASGPSYRDIVESTFLARLGAEEYNTSADRAGIYGAVTAGDGQTELLLVNTNATFAVNVTFGASPLAFAGEVTMWSWSPGEASPVESLSTGPAPTSVILDPTSIALLVGTGNVTAASGSAAR